MAYESDDEATEEVATVQPDDDPPEYGPAVVAVPVGEIEFLRRGYERNRRRSRIGLALGMLALVAVLTAAPGAIALLVKQDRIAEVVHQLRHDNRREVCRAQIEAAHDGATTEFFAAILSRPVDTERIDRAIAALNRVRSLRGSVRPCRNAAKLDAIVTRPPTNAEPTTTTPPTTQPPSRATVAPATRTGTASATTSVVTTTAPPGKAKRVRSAADGILHGHKGGPRSS